jgi:hypothetical protein
MKLIAMTLVFVGFTAGAWADPLTCDLSGYKPATDLSASVANNALTVAWSGDRNQDLRLRFAIVAGTPTIEELAVRKRGGAWNALAANVTPDFRVISGLRRMSNQQMAPLRGLGVELTPEIVDKYRWEPFWDAPLDLAAPSGRGGNPPPADGVANQPGFPRRRVPHDQLSGAHQRRAPRGRVSRRPVGSVCRHASILNVSRQQSDPAGDSREDQRIVGCLQVSRRAERSFDQ